MYLTITIDTEEDNWGEYDRPSYSVENIGRIPGLQRLFDERGVRPTYLVSYPVATSAMAVDVLGACHARGGCEIGTHPHPWNTPPVDEPRTPFNSFISHLSPDLQFRKIKTLHDTLAANFGAPRVYRSGRWGFNRAVARNLMRLGYRVDTSISPTIDWREYEGPDYSTWSCEPFVFRDGEDAGRTLIEIPATVDFVQEPRAAASAVYRTLQTGVPLGGKVAAALARLRVLNRASICPEFDSVDSMVRLTRALMRRGIRVITMFFHSPSLLEGCSPFGRTPADVEALLGRIERYLDAARSLGLQPRTMSEVAGLDIGATRTRLLSEPDLLGADT